MKTDTYLIRSFEHEMGGKVCWWRPNECGYTSKLEEAGLYPKHRAEEICKRANFGKQINEKAVHVNDALSERPRKRI